MTRIADLGERYRQEGLSEEEAGDDPIALFRQWYDVAVSCGLSEPNAMTLATATPDGRPSARVVLLRGFDERGLTFFTNYDSRKGRELAVNPYVALVLLWQDLDRQVRVEGSVSKLSSDESDAYFKSRLLGSRLGAWASAQSTVIPDREYLEAQQAAFAKQYAEREVPRPPYWGGFRVTPTSFEFWQGRPDRLHDRFLFRRDAGRWIRQRLSP